MGKSAETNCQRSSRRLQYIAAVRISCNGNVLASGNLLDISEHGIFVKIDNAEKFYDNVGHKVDVAIMVMQESSRLTIEILGIIKRVSDVGVGVQFTTPLRWWPIFTLFPIDEDFMFGVVASA